MEESAERDRNLVEEAMLAGLGVLALNAEAADAFADRLAATLGIDPDKARAAVRDTLTAWKREVDRLGDRPREARDSAVSKLGLIRREELDELALRVAQLDHRLKLLERERRGGA